MTIVLSIVATLRAAPAAQPTPREAFERGRTAFGRAEYRRAIEILNPLLYPEVVLDSEGEVVQAHRMLGVAYLYANRPADAKREFHKLLELRPDYRFDPLLDPQPVVDTFNAVVKEEETEIAAIEMRRHQRDEELAARRQREARLHPASASVVVYERHSYLLNFVPFGAGQFQNGQRRKGWLFLSVEGGLAAISLGAFLTNFALYGIEPRRHCLIPRMDDATGLPVPCPTNQIDHSQENTSRYLLGVQLVSGGLFLAAAIWGVVDALRHCQRDMLLPTAPTTGDLRVGLSPFGLSASLQF
ncbi:MAG TPA: tetratricopeptide repeat protein [Polyangia bacterium]|nr:tetratricopeptide repeat protein [Polyangia bacterium]